MGWHTLKRIKSKDKCAKSKKEISTLADEILQTLLAKALYDNLADAPDELSFRKGDIVTVIERDVDGLVGWWLCLLHGRQGIVPGNRLQVIPSMELDAFERDTCKRSSYETDEFSDSADVVENTGHFYDVVPTKAHPPPLSIKDMFNIPYKSSQSSAEELYDVPKSQCSEELYDVPKTPSLTSQEEVYDVPKTDTRSTSEYEKPSSELYDVPKRDDYDKPRTPSVTRSTDLYDVPKPTNTSEELYDVPKPNADQEIAALMGEIYDSPFNSDSAMSTIKRSPKASLISSPRHSRELSAYNGNLLNTNEELCVTPKQVSTYDPSMLSTNVTSKTVFDEFYDVPAFKSTHRHTETSSSTLPRGFSPHSNSSPRNSAEIYDVPSKKSDRNSLDSSRLQQTASVNSEIYDIPKSNADTQEIYDVPAKQNDKNSLDSSRLQQTASVNSEIYDTPKSNADTQEIYDVPAKQNDKNSLDSSRLQQTASVNSEIYDTPKSNADTQEIYDVPARHNINDVMADVSYTSHYKGPRNVATGNLILPDVDDDDYVDYHDIWSDEPPTELVQQHTKTMSPHSPAHTRLSSNSSTDSHKKSILDQINFEAVKELDMSKSEAVERLSKLHLAVDTCVQNLLSFCMANWLDVASLERTIPSIKNLSSKLKTVLRLLTEFGLGALVNTTRSTNGEILMDKLIGEVEPLLESYYKVKICLMHLDGSKWVVPKSRSSSTDKFFATLNAIMILSQRIPEQCRLFSLAVQNNVAELFAPDSLEEVTQQMGSLVNQLRNTSESLDSAIKTTDEKTDFSGRRQQARDSSYMRPVPKIPPKPTLPTQRRSLAGVLEPPESPRVVNLGSRGFGHIERLVTDYTPDNSRQKKYASDPATPSHQESQKSMWGGSCPLLLDRHSTVAATRDTSSSIGVNIIEEESAAKSTTPLHYRSTSQPIGERTKKNVFDFEEGLALSPLDHRDIEALEFFCRQVESQVMLLREAMKNLTETVENREEPVQFVSHSKFIILTAHKVVHGGQEISERLINQAIKKKLKEGTSHLTVCIRAVVSATKTAAVEFPDPGAMMEMISSVLAIGDAVRIIHSECRRALDA